MLLANVSLGDLLWSMLVIFFMVIFFMILFSIIGDLFRDHEMSGWGKAAWIIFLIFVPFLAMFIYLIVRGGGMAQRSMKANVAAQQQMSEYAQQMAAAQGGGNPTDQIAQAHDLLAKGAITQAEFDAIKAKALGA